jgi:hypothetical protein
LPILADLGYQGILHTCQGAILPHKKPPGRELTDEQKEHNRLVAKDRVIVENYFARWKTLFNIIHELLFRGSLKKLPFIVKLAIAMTNFYLLHHPLRKESSEMASEDEDAREAAESGEVFFLDELTSDDEMWDLAEHASSTPERPSRTRRHPGDRAVFSRSKERFISYSEESDSD